MTVVACNTFILTIDNFISIYKISIMVSLCHRNFLEVMLMFAVSFVCTDYLALCCLDFGTEFSDVTMFAD